MKISEFIYKDIKSYKAVGFDGLISCQAQRVLFPTGLPNYVMAKVLWNESLSFDETVNEYFEGAFGENYKSAKEYLNKIVQLFKPSYYGGRKWGSEGNMSNERKSNPQAICGRMREAQKHIADFTEQIYKNIISDNECHAISWKHLSYHGEICMILAQALESEAAGDIIKQNAFHKMLVDLVMRDEDELQEVLDSSIFAFCLNLK